MTEEREIVVVGGGPAGAAAASVLRQRGRDVLLLDEARFPRDKVCGEAVSPGAWPLLEAMGASEAVRRLRPSALAGMTLTAPDGTSFTGRYADRQGFGLRRTTLDQALLGVARCAGAEVREATRVTDLVLERGEVRGVVCADGQGSRTILARLVVGADGRRSVVARRLGLLHEHRRLRRFAVRGHWAGMQGLCGLGEMHVGGGGYCGVCPLPDSEANVAFVLDQGEMAAAAGDVEAFYRSSLERRWPRLAQRLRAARLLAPPRAIGPLALEASALHAPGVLLAGDAAGFYDPFTGEGITLALRSAALLAEVADGALAGRTRFADYAARRAAVTRDKFQFNRLLQRVVSWPALANAVARRLARRPDLADELVGIAGDFVPARRALGVGFLLELLWGGAPV